MLVHTIIFLLFVSLIDTVEKRSGFAEEYLKKNYTSLIRQTRYMTSKQVDSKLSCLLECLNVNDCSMTVFNQTNSQCLFYNIFPVIDQELLPDNDIIVFVFQRTIQLSTSISDTNWLIFRLNTIAPTQIVSVPRPRCLVMDIFGYILTLQATNNTTYINRYDRTSLTVVESIALSMNYTPIGMLTYYNGMIFVTSLTIISIFDHINFVLLGIIDCGSNLHQPRDIIVIETQNIMIIASQRTNKLFFVRFYSPTNYTCLYGASLSISDPQALLKINETFFYVTTWSNTGVYSYHYAGGVWIPSLFANITQTLGTSITGLGHLQIDNFERRWIMAVGFGLVIYDQWGTFLGMWRFGNGPFDIYISNNYRLIISDIGTSKLTLYELNIIV